MPHRRFPQRQRGNARRLRTNMTDAERKLWQRLRAHRFLGASFRRQVLLGPFITDFVCHDAKLVIELDGGQHAEPCRSETDRHRTEWLAVHGYKTIRFWNNEVLNNMDGVLNQIEDALCAIPPSRSGAQRRADLPLKGRGVSENRP